METRFLDFITLKNKYQSKDFGIISILEDTVIKVNGIKYEVSKFDLVLLKPDNEYWFSKTGINVILLDIENYYVYFIDQIKYPLTIYKKTYDIEKLLNRIYSEFNKKDIYYEEYISNILGVLVINLLRSLNNKNENVILLIDSLKLYIEKNLNKIITLDELSVLLNLKKSTMNYFFKKNFELTPIDYVNRYKIEIAKEIIYQTKKIDDVRIKLGFNSVSSFSRWFKNIDGKNPGYYKKNKN